MNIEQHLNKFLIDLPSCEWISCDESISKVIYQLFDHQVDNASCFMAHCSWFKARGSGSWLIAEKIFVIFKIDEFHIFIFPKGILFET